MTSGIYGGSGARERYNLIVARQSGRRRLGEWMLGVHLDWRESLGVRRYSTRALAKPAGKKVGFLLKLPSAYGLTGKRFPRHTIKMFTGGQR
jgi:hypothetical protein